MSFVFWASIFSVVLLVPSLGLVVWRLLRGPSSADRIIATDMLGLLGICVAALTACFTRYPAYLDIAVGIALFGFLGAVAFAGLLERAQIPESEENNER